MTMVLTPARLAARIFSLMPPTGSTRPRRVISPVIAMPLFRAWPRRAETIELTIVMPAEGPSLGTAPSGTWTWMSLPMNWSVSICASSGWALMYCQAICADSFMTSPRLPVMDRTPLPLETELSTKRISPPSSVQARPVTTPGASLPCCLSWKAVGRPRYSRRCSFFTTFGYSSSRAIFFAVTRAIFAICFSRPRTPDSCVYSSMMSSRHSLSISRPSFARPCSSSCLGTR